MSDVLVLGAAMTPFGRFPDVPEEGLVQRAVVEALRDAGIAGRRVQAVYCGSAFAGMLPGQRALKGLDLTGPPFFNVDNACSSGASAVHLAAQALRLGLHDTVLVIGVDKLSRFGGGTLPLDQQDWSVRRGLTMPSLYAMRAMRYLHERDEDVGLLADVAVKNRRHGAGNPKAQLRSEVTRAEVLASRPVATPLTRDQCCPSTTDGAAALVLGARPMGQPAVRLRATAVQSGKRDCTTRSIIDAEITARTAHLAYEAGGIDPRDLDVVETHDAFSVAELLYYEALGLCGPGDGPALLRSGATAIGGRIPVSPSGGLLSRGHPPGATGVAQMVEIHDQLLGRCGRRQIEGAKLGLAHCTGGGVSGLDHAACAVSILERAA